MLLKLFRRGSSLPKQFCAESYDSSVVVSCVSLVNKCYTYKCYCKASFHFILFLSLLTSACFFVHHPSYFQPIELEAVTSLCMQQHSIQLVSQVILYFCICIEYNPISTILHLATINSNSNTKVNSTKNR